MAELTPYEKRVVALLETGIPFWQVREIAEATDPDQPPPTR